MRVRRVGVAVAAALTWMVAAPAARADLVNGGFESGNFNGWSTIGSASVVGSQTLSPGGSNYVINPYGSSQAFLQTGGSADAAGLESFLGLQSGSLLALGNGTPTVGAAIKQTVTVSAGDTLTFNYNFVAGDYVPFNDFAFLSIAASPGASTLSSITQVGSFGSTGYQSQTFTFATGGTYTIGVGVIDTGDTAVTSYLFADQFQVSSFAVPEPTTTAMGLTGMALMGGGLGRLRRRLVGTPALS